MASSGSGEAASVACPLPKGKAMAATTHMVRMQHAPEEQYLTQGSAARLVVQCATSLIRGC